MSEELAVRQQQVLSRFRLIPNSLGEAMEMAKIITATELCPKAYRGKPQDAIVAYEFGQALGLSWLQALRNVASINGVPSLYGDALPAVIMGTGECTRFKEWIDGEGDQRTAHCIIGRKGYPDEFNKTFSIADAKRANLWGKAGPWVTYPDRMLQWRSTGFTGRAAFPDKLSGLILAEEAADYPDAIDAQVVHTEVVIPAIERIPEGLRDNMEKAFETLSMSAAQRLAKVNEFLGKDGVSPEEGAQALLDWCRDEFAKRKTGQPRKKADNGKSAPPQAPSAQAASSVVDPKQGESDVRAAGPEVLEEPASPPTPSEMPAVHEIPWSRGELF